MQEEHNDIETYKRTKIQKEINNIKIILINRYNVKSPILIKLVAIELYQNGITSQIINSFYNDKFFDLDEIVLHIMNKTKNQDTPSSKEIKLPKNTIINFQSKKRKKILLKQNNKT